jgi:hypothetical protein
VTYGGELMVSLQYDASVLSALVADDLLRLFDKQLAATADIEEEAAVPATSPSQLLTDVLG